MTHQLPEKAKDPHRHQYEGSAGSSESWGQKLFRLFRQMGSQVAARRHEAVDEAYAMLAQNGTDFHSVLEQSLGAHRQMQDLKLANEALAQQVQEMGAALRERDQRISALRAEAQTAAHTSSGRQGYGSNDAVVEEGRRRVAQEYRQTRNAIFPSWGGVNIAPILHGLWGVVDSMVHNGTVACMAGSHIFWGSTTFSCGVGITYSVLYGVCAGDNLNHSSNADEYVRFYRKMRHGVAGAAVLSSALLLSLPFQAKEPNVSELAKEMAVQGEEVREMSWKTFPTDFRRSYFAIQVQRRPDLEKEKGEKWVCVDFKDYTQSNYYLDPNPLYKVQTGSADRKTMCFTPG